MGCPCNCPTETCLNFPVNNTTGTSQFDPCYEIDLCTEGCEETLSSKCVIYKGPNLTCSGLSSITTNTNTQTIIQSLYSMICGLKTELTNLQDQINNCCDNATGIQFTSLGAIGCTREVAGLIGVLGLSNPLAVGESIVVEYNGDTLVLGTDYTLTRVGDVWRVNVSYNSGDSGELTITATNSLGTNSTTYNISCPCVVTVSNVDVTCVGGQNEVTFTLAYSNVGPEDLYIDSGSGPETFTQTTSPQDVTFNLPGGNAGTVPVEFGIVGNESCVNTYDVDTLNCCYINAVQTAAVCEGTDASYYVDITWLNAISESGTITIAVTGSSSYTDVTTLAYNTFDGTDQVVIVVPLSITGVSIHVYFTSDNGCDDTLALTYPICS